MKQICIICGSPVFRENLCEKCFIEKNELFELPAKIHLKHCTNCGAYRDKSWIYDTLENIIRNKIRPKDKILSATINIDKNHSIVECTGYIKPSRKIKKEIKHVEIKIERRKCDNCIKLLSGYYQGIFQIRGQRKNKILKRLMYFVKPDEIIMEENKDGYDIKFVDKKTASRVATLLKDFQIKKSYKLITEKKGKKLYRNYYAIR